MEKLEVLCIASENIKWPSYFGHSSAARQMIKHELAYDLVIPLLGIDPREMRTICPHGKLYTNVYSSMVHTSPKVETPQVSINEWIIHLNLTIH